MNIEELKIAIEDGDNELILDCLNHGEGLSIDEYEELYQCACVCGNDFIAEQLEYDMKQLNLMRKRNREEEDDDYAYTSY